VKTILFVPEFNFFGGPYTYFKRLIEFFKSQNFKVKIALKENQVNKDVLSFIKDFDYEYYILATKKIEKRNHIITNFSLIRNILIFSKLLPIYFKIKPDIIVVSTGNPGSFLGLVILPASFIYILHSYPVNGKKLSFKSFILNIYLGKYKRILTVSNFARKNIIKYWHLSSKENSIDFIHNTTEGISNYNKVDILKNKLVVLTIGHVRWYKNPELWFYIAKKVLGYLKNSTVNFVWIGDGEALDKYRKRVKKLKIHNINFLGYKNDVEAFLNTADIYLQPSLLESHGLSVLDAMRHKLPCVVSNIGGLPESVVDESTGFVIDVDDENKFVEKILLLIRNKDLREKMGQLGYKRYIENFSNEVWQNKMEKLYNEMLDIKK